MKTKLFNLVTAACLLFLPFQTFGQTERPTMGTTENFVLFTTDGALTNQGASQLTLLTGDVGSDTAPNDTELGNIDGTIYSTGDTEGVTAQAAADLVDLYDELLGLVKDYDLPTLLGGTDVFPPGVYSIDESTTLDGNLILDADDDPDALFIFRITSPGTFSTTANSSIELRNDAQACNVFWLVEDAVNIATGNFMKGTIVSAAAIEFAATTEFEGRALTKVGAITIDNDEQSFLAQKPICDGYVPTGPVAPNLATAGSFALFTGNGSMTNSGESTIVGDVGSHTAAPTGFVDPTTVDGTVYAGPTPETEQADLDLGYAFDYLVALPHDIELLKPALFGHDLILTPHTYQLAAETHLTGDLYLDAQGNPDAVFVIKVEAAFLTTVDSRVLLINEAKAENVYWKITSAVSIEAGSIFEGTILAAGAVELKSGVELNGSALTKTGDFSTVAIIATSSGEGEAHPPDIITQPTDQVADEGGSATFTVEASGANLTYQWRKGTTDLDDDVANISGATTATLTIDPVTIDDEANNYNVVVTGSVDPPATSADASLTISSEDAPEIITQPTDQVADEGGSANFTVEATGANLTYQWRKGTTDLDDDAENISGATTATLTIDPVSIDDEADNYNVVVTGSVDPPATSDDASLTVNTAPEITTQPTDQVADEGGSATFTVEASGANLTYQWRKGTTDLDDDAENISGATTATLTIDPVTIDDEADNYNVVVTGSVDPPATSDNVSLSVTSTGIDIIDSGNAFTIYPNPFNVSLNIKLNDALKGNKYELVIYNVLGEVVRKTAITGQITTIETGNIRSGVYFYKVMDNDITIQSGKMLKQK